MKRFTISIVILFFIITISCAAPLYLKKTTLQLTNQIDEINTDIKNNNIDNALLKTHQLSNYWSKQKDIITIFVSNDEIDNATFAIAKLTPLLEYNRTGEFCSNLNYVKSIIISVYHDDMPTLNNIF